MKLKGFNKLMLQVIGLAIVLISVSFFTETDLWYDHFNYAVGEGRCTRGAHVTNDSVSPHLHWNYRGIIYVWMGFILTTISIVRIVMSHKKEDFK